MSLEFEIQTVTASSATYIHSDITAEEAQNELTGCGDAGVPDDRTVRVNYLTPQFENIPATLRQEDRWIIWGLMPRPNKKPKKIPLQLNGYGASSTNPAHRVSFDAARDAYLTATDRGYMIYREGDQTHHLRPGGIGFVFDESITDEDGYTIAGIDFDGVIEHTTTGHKLTDTPAAVHARKFIASAKSYTEKSVSGTGLHTIVKAKPIDTGVSVEGVEVYTTGRYFAFTGHCIGKTPAPVVEADFQVRSLLISLRGRGYSSTIGVIPGRLQFEQPGHMSFTQQLAAGRAVASTAANDTLGAGVNTSWFDDLDDDKKIEVVKHALNSLPQGTLDDEGQWMLVARALAHTAMRFPALKDSLFDALDEVSRDHSGYDREDNARRFERYIDEAGDDRYAAGHTTIGSLLQAASRNAADFGNWKHAKSVAATTIGNTVETLAPRKPLVPANYSPADALTLCRDHFFYAAAGGVVSKQWAQIMADGSLELYTRRSFGEAFANYNVAFTAMSGGNPTTTLVPMVPWLEKHQQRRNARIVFDPSATTGPDEFNLWQGFAHSPSKGGALHHAFLRHLWVNISQRRKSVFKYLLRWLAHCVQYPHKPIPVALILYGKEFGAGKSFVGKVMKHLLGRHGREAKLSDLTGNFNFHTVAWSLMWLDETYLDKASEKELRKQLTAATRRIEVKGGSVTNPDNCLHIIITNNAEIPVPVGDGDRRYACLQAGTEHVKDRPYFKSIWDNLEAGGFSSLLSFLQRIDLSGWNPEMIPDTAERQELMDMSQDEVTSWLQACIDDDGITGTAGAIVAAGVTRSQTTGLVALGQFAPVAVLRNAFYAYCASTGKKTFVGDRQLSNRLTKVLGKSVNPSNVRGYGVPDAATLQAMLNKWRGKI